MAKVESNIATRCHRCYLHTLHTLDLQLASGTGAACHCSAFDCHGFRSAARRKLHGHFELLQVGAQFVAVNLMKPLAHFGCSQNVLCCNPLVEFGAACALIEKW